MGIGPTTTSSKQQIHNSLARWTGTLSPEDLPLFRAFVAETLSRLRGPFIAQHTPTAVLSYLEEAFQFAREREPDEARVAILRREERGIAVLTCMVDQPFIVDTIRLFLRSSKATYSGGFNLVFKARRDHNGALVGFGDRGRSESLVMLEADDGSIGLDLEGALDRLRLDIDLARAMVRDFKPMVRAVERLVEKCELQADRRPEQAESLRETAAFLKWLMRDNFVFMGVDGGEPLGIQSVDGPYRGTTEGQWGPRHDPGTVRVRKSQTESPVHRAGRIDEILVTIGDEGEPHGMSLFVRGMFTYRAVTQPSRNVPILRRMLARILAEQESAPGSYRYKGMANVFDSLPTEFLFTASKQATAEMVDLVFDSEQQQEVAVTFLMTGDETAFCLVAMPKTQYGDELRREVEHEIVSSLLASYCDHGIFVGRFDTVLLHYYLTGIEFPGDERIAALTNRIRQLATPWLARLWQALADHHDEVAADRLADTYGRAFPEPWMRHTSAVRAVRDIEMLERLAGGSSVQADVFRDDAGALTLRLYEAEPVFLTGILPVLDNFGLTVIDGYATEVHSRGGTLHVDTFRVQKAAGVTNQALLERAPLLIDALEAVFRGDVANDPLNALVLSGALTWDQVDVIRGYTRYCRQLQIKLSTPRAQEILLSHPQMCGSLTALFAARFDPDVPEGERAARMAEAEETITNELRYIQSHDEDLLFSSLHNLITATLRTNAFRTDRPSHCVSFKLLCSAVRGLGSSRPMYEIYVHNKDVEGVHLRFGAVARGGLRWSDRDDFRTEVLSLATTQQVKNVVIVPTGSKGGFYLKNASRDPKVRREQADTLYATFIRGLLDVTDNSQRGTIVPPPRVVRHDGDDPYLVVAADKGTAHLSDTANGISRERGFWLDDAFASGGSNGYDHKGVGITARGAWVLVHRHFAELGIDALAQDFTCVGIGDMGGDVFGNGLIESKHTRLLAAFNHLHVFLDPDPDPATSYAERVRLFETQGGWDQYDKALISEGGGVYDRRAKSMPLSPAVQELLGLHQAEAEPELVVHHILKLKVDLLWNGGIGTYVKASHETHGNADDRSNDAVRIDATELQARIVGEGGNLGFTQPARIEAARLGVRLNTDALDNSGGVDLSDHEVNLKILLQRVVERGDLTMEARNALLEELTDEVADLVLADNDAHGRQVSRDELRSREDIFQFGRAISFVEGEFGRHRRSLHLPDEAELQRRAREGEGLTRPELAVLQAWVKMYVYRALLAEDAQLPGAAQMLHEYFPARIRAEYPDDIDQHMLARQIAMTVATSRIVADAGASFFPRVIEQTGASVGQIATAYLHGQELAGVRDVRRVLGGLRSTVSLSAAYRAWVLMDAGVRDVAMFWLSSRGRMPTEREIVEMRQAADEVYALQAEDVLQRDRGLMDTLLADNFPQEVALRVLKAQHLNIALLVWAEAKRSTVDFKDMVVHHLSIGRASRLQRVLDDLAHRPATGRWDPSALHILHSRFHDLLRQLVRTLPLDTEHGSSVDALEQHLVHGPLAAVRAQVDAVLGEEEHASVSTLLVLEEQVSAAVQRLDA